MACCKKLQAAFKPDLFVNHYGSSEIYTFTIDQNAPAKPGSAGRAGINQMVRVVKLGATSVDEIAAAGEEGEIIALFAGDESFEGYWRRPDADAKALRAGWYFTGDTGYVDGDGDIFVTGRVDDMIITGGENVSPVEIESCLSLHAGGVGGRRGRLAGRALGQDRRRFHQAPRARSRPTSSTRSAARPGLANFKRPRRYVFVAEIPKSPVGKLLRRKLVAGEYRRSSRRSRPRASKEPPHDRMFSDPRLQTLDGFRVEIDAARERADIVLDRPPLNVIEMGAARSASASCSRRSTRMRACA